MRKDFITEVPEPSLREEKPLYEQTDVALTNLNDIEEIMVRTQRTRGMLSEELREGVISEHLNAAIALADRITEKIKALQASKNQTVRVAIAEEVNALTEEMRVEIQKYREGSGFEN